MTTPGSPYDSQPTKESPTAHLWPEGNYSGQYQSFRRATAMSGNPVLSIDFLVNGQIKTVDMTITEAVLKSFGAAALQVLNVSGDYFDDTLAFDPPSVVGLWMKHDVYGGRVREKWNISAREAVPLTDAVKSAAQRAWAALVSHGVTPAVAPPVPPRPAPPPPVPPRPAPKLEAGISTMEQAWIRWLTWLPEDTDGAAFYSEIEKYGEPETLTPAQWQAIAIKHQPF